MSDEAVSLRDINWRETFPFTHLFRAFRVAVHPSKLILALVALGFLWCGGLILDAVWFHDYRVTSVELLDLGLRESPSPIDSGDGQGDSIPEIHRESQAEGARSSDLRHLRHLLHRRGHAGQQRPHAPRRSI